jgi:hypothetical protein
VDSGVLETAIADDEQKKRYESRLVILYHPSFLDDAGSLNDWDPPQDPCLMKGTQGHYDTAKPHQIEK